MAELHTAALIADADLADDVEFPVRLGSVAGLLKATLAKIRTWLVDADGTLAGNSDLKVASQKAVKTYIDNAVSGVLDIKGGTDCSTSPNYPAAVKGDAYYVTVAGKIGGASGKAVDVGDLFFASANNAGGDQATVGASWVILEHNLVGALLAANNLADVANPATARANLGLGSAALAALDTDGALAADSDTNVASQKAVVTFVAAQIAAAFGSAANKRISIQTVTGTTYTFVTGDAATHIRFTNAAAVTATVNTGVFSVGDRVRMTAAGAGGVTLVAGSGVTLNSRGNSLGSAGQWAVFEIECVAAGVFDVLGDMA